MNGNLRIAHEDGERLPLVADVTERRPHRSFGQVLGPLLIDPVPQLIEHGLAADTAHPQVLVGAEQALIYGVALDTEQLQNHVEGIACFGCLLQRAKQITSRM